jgi:ParB family chromosome partitioning protein
VDVVRPNNYQPRVSFDEVELDGLAASIEALGVLQPVIVRPVGGGRYELIAGERRWRAAQRAGLLELPAIVRPVDDRSSLEQAVVENLHRVDLNVLEEAAAYRQLIDEFGLTQEDVSRRVGRSRPAVANALRLLQLPVGVQRLIRTGLLSAGHARAMLAWSDPETLEELAATVVDGQLSVRQVEDLVRKGPAAGRGVAGAVLGPSPGGRSGRSAAVMEVEQMLAERLDTRVQVSMAGAGGRLVIEFADLEDLDRVFRALGGGRPEVDLID